MSTALSVPAGHRGRLWQLLLLALAVWAGSYARIAIGPLQEGLRVALALSDNQIALLQGPAIALSIMAGSVPLGLLVDRYSRPRILTLLLLFGLAGSVMTALASSFLALFAARALVGLVAIGCFITAFSAMADLYPPEQRGRGTMVVAGGAELSSPAAFALGGALLAYYGSGGDGWRWALLWTTTPALLLAFVCMFALREPPRVGLRAKNPPIKAVFAELWRHRGRAAPLLVARCMVWVADGATVIWAAPLLSRRFNLPPDRVGAIMALILLVAGFSSPVLGGLLADFGQRTGGPQRTMWVLSGLAFLALPASLFAISPDVLSTSILLSVFITLGFMTNIAAAALSTIVIPDHIRGTYLSMSQMVGALFGVALAPLLVSGLCGALGGPAMIGEALVIVCLISSLTGALIFTLAGRHFPDRVYEPRS